MHNTLHQFLSSMANGAISQASLFAEPQEEKRLALPGLDHLLRLYESCWIDEWYPNEVIRDEYRTKGAESLKAYYAFLASTKPTIAYLEKDFSLKIGSVTVKGRIDRIDEIEGGFEIIDYKTGSPKTSEKLSWEDRRQLILYAIAAEKCFDPPLKIVKLSYHYLEDASVVSFEPTEKDCEKLEQEILTTVEKIKTSDFAPTPGFHCQFCDFKDICEFSQA